MRLVLILLMLWGLCAGVWAQDAVRIDLERQLDYRIPIAVPDFASSPGQEALGQQMAAIVARDLQFTGLFKVIAPDAYPKSFSGFSQDPTQIDFAAWRASGAEHLVYAHVIDDVDAIVAECRLFDVFSHQQVVGKRFVGKKKWPRPERLVAHYFADEIVLFLTGVAGVASSEICFSADALGHKEIFVADYDGMQVTQATQHGSISIRPKFSPDGRRIAYLSYKDRFPFLYVYDRETGKSVPLSKNVGLNVSAAWAPDGASLAMVLSKDGNPEIYLKNADGSGEQRLTHDKAVDSSPAFDPSGRRIVFVSERGGSAQLYVMNADGSNVQRLSFQGGRAYDPAWSPDGKSIAYAVEKRDEGRQIYVVNADGSNAKRVTTSPGSKESPSWSADSRHLVFAATRGGVSELWTVTLETGEEHRVPSLGTRCEGPFWGPRRN